MGALITTLTEYEERECIDIATATYNRHRAYDKARGYAFANNNNKIANPEKDLLTEIRVTCGEKVVTKYFPRLEWHALHDFRKGCPDIGSFIDVKTPDQQPGRPARHLIAYDSQIVRDWAYVLVLPCGKRRFAVMGWAWGRELAAAPIKSFQVGRPAHYLPATKPPLYEICHLQLIASWRREYGTQALA